MANRPLRILVVASNLRDEYLALDIEIATISQIFEAAIFAGRVQLEVLRGATTATLVDKVRTFKPNIFHFSGLDNGIGEPLLCAPGNANDTVAEDMVEAGVALPFERLRDSLGTARGHIRCVVLNTSRSVLVTQRLVPAFPFAVGTRDQIPDGTACLFSEHFYGGIAAGESLFEAFYNTSIWLDEYYNKKLGLLQHKVDDDFPPEALCLLPCSEPQSPEPNSPGASGPPARVLLIACQPRGTEPLPLGEELDAMLRLLHSSPYARRLHLGHLWNPTIRDLEMEVSRLGPCLIHFTGHATPRGEPLLTNDHGDGKPLDLASLRRILEQERDGGRLKCVVFNMADTAAFAAELRSTVPVTIAMDQKVLDLEARLFTISLYEMLFFGHCLRRAFEAARMAPRPVDDGFVEVPRLHHDAAVDPTRIFLVTSRERPTAPRYTWRRGAETALAEALDRMFTPEEFVRFLRTTADTATLTGELGPLSPVAQFFATTVSLLVRHGAIEPAFFDRWLAVRPRCGAEILEARARCLIPQV